MEKVVYLLGAGFSAPLGIPVMRNFLTKSRDLYYSDQAKFAHFQEVFNTINELSVIKNFYSSDLFNIEEILSILEMREYLEGEELKANFLEYLADVINHYTPELRPYGPKLTTNWQDVLFTPFHDSTWRGYGHFISTICNLILANREEASQVNTNRFIVGLTLTPMLTTQLSHLTMTVSRNQSSNSSKPITTARRIFPYVSQSCMEA